MATPSPTFTVDWDYLSFLQWTVEFGGYLNGMLDNLSSTSTLAQLKRGAKKALPHVQDYSDQLDALVPSTCWAVAYRDARTSVDDIQNFLSATADGSLVVASQWLDQATGDLDALNTAIQATTC